MTPIHHVSARIRGEVLWQPDGLSTSLDWYIDSLDRPFSSYQQLWQWSVACPDLFWSSIWSFFDVQSSRPYMSVLEDRSMPGARWFSGAELSYAEHIFRDRGDGDVAIVYASEGVASAEMSWAELRELTGRIRCGLARVGVGRGDRVAAYLPNVPEAVAAFLACASLGAVWSSVAPEFGAQATIDRLGQIEPKVLLGVDGYRYGGREFDRRRELDTIQEAIPALEAVFVLPYLRSDGNWNELLGTSIELEFEQLPFDHPLWVLFTSGTTGPPKGLVHGQGGILLEHLKALSLHTNVGPGDRMFWFTTTAWMMWNYLVSGLLTGATIVLYDGSPASPDLGALWDLAEQADVTCFGTSAAFIHANMNVGYEPRKGRDLSGIRAIGSTGSPLSPEGFRWVYDSVSPDTWLFSMSGGTDLCTAFVGGVPTLPVRAGELQGRALGANVQAFDVQGRSVIGEVGELVITDPMPSMPLGLWEDPSFERYRASYFDTYPNVWRHGDWIEIAEDGSAVITGRSDATINRAGVRIGTAEIYRAVSRIDEVTDALVVDLPHEGPDGTIVLYVVTTNGTLDDELTSAIRASIRDHCSPRHVPDETHVVPELPRTRSGKLIEVPIKRILSGELPEAAVDPNTLANPQALQYFEART